MGNEAYQERDAAYFDYQLFERFDFSLRGPEWPVDAPADFNIVGSARVFGRFVDKPLTTVLADEYGITARNLGTAGGNPYMYMKRPDLLEFLATSPGVPIFQVCGADGHTNDWFTRITGRTMRVKADGLGVAVGSNVRGGIGYRTAFRRRPFDEVLAQIRKGQEFIIEDYKELKKALGRPAVIMYFSDRPLRPLDKTNFPDMFRFPHCVDRVMWDALKEVFEYSLEIHCDTGTPFTVGTGKDAVKVELYPSVEMHRAAAREIAAHRDRIMAVAAEPAKPVALARPSLQNETPAGAGRGKGKRGAEGKGEAGRVVELTPAVVEKRRIAAEERRKRREASGR